jgi:hypothetical protein
MKKNKHQNKKIIVGVAWLCVALVSSVYALDCPKGVEDRCNNGPYPVSFPGAGPGGSTVNTSNDADCCTTACMILNPSNSDAAGECAANCIADLG